MDVITFSFGSAPRKLPTPSTNVSYSTDNPLLRALAATKTLASHQTRGRPRGPAAPNIPVTTGIGKNAYLPGKEGELLMTLVK